MSLDSIFDGIVSKENEYTQLFCNMMGRYDDFRGRVLKLLLGNGMTVGGEEQIEVQDRSSEAGCPDIKISSADLYVLIEVKTDPKCPLSKYQDLVWEGGTFTGYAGEACKQNKKKSRVLVYLVPQGWEQWKWLEQKRESLKSKLNAVRLDVQIKSWEDLLKAAEQASCASAPLMEEFIKLMAKTFKPLKFDKEELDILFSARSQTAYDAVIKAMMIVDRVREFARAKGYGSQIEGKVVKFQEYGVYFKTVRGEDLLWFGIFSFTDGTDASRFSFGVYDGWHDKVLKTFDAAALKGKKIKYGKWAMAYFRRELLESADPAKAIWDELEPLLAALEQSLSKRKATAATSGA